MADGARTEGPFTFDFHRFDATAGKVWNFEILLEAAPFGSEPKRVGIALGTHSLSGFLGVVGLESKNDSYSARL